MGRGKEGLTIEDLLSVKEKIDADYDKELGLIAKQHFLGLPVECDPMMPADSYKIVCGRKTYFKIMDFTYTIERGKHERQIG